MNNHFLPSILDKYTSQFGTGSQYAYYHDEDETTFHLVDTARVQKPPYQRGRFRGGGRHLRYKPVFMFEIQFFPNLMINLGVVLRAVVGIVQQILVACNN